MKLKKEERILQSPEYKLRSLEEDGKRYFEGYASVYNSRSRLIAEGGKMFYEYIREGAFDDALQREDLDVKLTFNHNKLMIMGRTKSGTLTLDTDEIGLKFRAEVPNTTLGNDTYEMVQRGDYPDCSFVFTIKENKWERDADGTPVHIVERVAGLYDVAICIDGAYEGTSISAEYARAIEDLDKPSKEDIQRDIDLELDSMKLDLLKIK